MAAAEGRDAGWGIQHEPRGIPRRRLDGGARYGAQSGLSKPDNGRLAEGWTAASRRRCARSPEAPSTLGTDSAVPDGTPVDAVRGPYFSAASAGLGEGVLGQGGVLDSSVVASWA